MEPFRPEGVNLPNVMTPGAWVIVSLIIAAILAGFTFMLVRFLRDRVWWKPIPGSPLEAAYFGKDHEPNLVRLNMALTVTVSLLVKHTQWKELDIVKALTGLRVYVQPVLKWQSGGQTVAGLTMGNTVMIGSDYAALLHECAHVCDEAIDKVIRYNHTGWDADGIRTAEAEYIKSLEPTT